MGGSSRCSEQIKTIPCVKGVILDGNHLQVVIGAEVQAVYAAMQKGEKQKWTVQSVLSFLAEVVAPILPFVIVAGILRGILMYFPVPFITGCINAVFSYGVPIALCYGAVKKAGGNEMLGLWKLWRC